MEYRKVGKSGLKVSSLCLGTMTFGDGAYEPVCHDIYTICREKGVNFFDCADVYAGGESERILGKLIKGHRDEVVIATKGFYPTSKDINGRGLSRFHLIKAVEASLERLDTDYIDVYYLHNFDYETPLEETLGTLNDLVRQGKVLYIGVSNFAAWQVMKTIGTAKENNFEGITCIQPMYNLLKRQCESELLPMALSEGVGVFSYSPLGGGYLTGKYLAEREGESRFDKSVMYQKRYEAEENLKTVKSFLKFAEENNFNPVSLAIAWVNAHHGITAPIIGGRNIEQLNPALASLDIEMTEDLRNTISDFSLTPALANDRAEERKGGNKKLY